jgi:membrane-associated phospholipid phosphatase
LDLCKKVVVTMTDHFFLANTKANTVANAVSMLVIIYTGAPFLFAAASPSQQNLIWGASVLVGPMVAEAIKRLTVVLGMQDWCRRPSGAANCDTWNRNGNQAGAPGFPSGHMTTTAAFWMGAFLLCPAEYCVYVVVFGTFAILLMALARMEKRCHTLLQVVAGTLLGAGISYGALRLRLRLLKN